MRINTNITAMNTYTQYTKNTNKISSSVAKLSSGYSINSAADNAAGLAISEKMRAQIRGLEKASTNSQDAISLIQTAEGALAESTEILQRMRELAVQSASDTNENEIDRTALQDEFSQLQAELNDISKNTTFNKKSLLDGSLAAAKKSLTNSNLANSGMTVELGNAATGTYNFSVTTRLEKAAVAGKAPTSFELVMDGTGDYFASGSVSAGSNVAESDLLNGNYTLNAEYGSDGGITVTAKGDNGQVFTANITAAALEGLASDTELEVTFNAEADDAFALTLNLNNTITPSENNFRTLANNLSHLAVSISGGVTAQAAEYGVYANLTGAESVKLEAGMSSVTFSNGIKVNFDTLTASAVDTANKGKIQGPIAGVGITAAADVSGVLVTYTGFKVFDDSSITNSTAASDFAITAEADGKTLTASIGGKNYTATVTAEQLEALGFAVDDVEGATNTLAGIVFNDESGKAAFTIDVTTERVKATSGTESASVITTAELAANASANGVVTDVGHNYAKVFGTVVNGDLSVSTASSFSVEASENAGLTFQVGANEGDEMVINIDKMDANYLGVASAGVASQKAASVAINAVDNAINQVSAQRAYLGAIQNRLDHKIANLNTSAENLTSAESLIRDVDMAKEMTNFTSANILQQAATAMLAQANALPQNVLSLIG